MGREDRLHLCCEESQRENVPFSLVALLAFVCLLLATASVESYPIHLPYPTYLFFNDPNECKAASLLIFSNSDCTPTATCGSSPLTVVISGFCTMDSSVLTNFTTATYQWAQDFSEDDAGYFGPGVIRLCDTQSFTLELIWSFGTTQATIDFASTLNTDCNTIVQKSAQTIKTRNDNYRKNCCTISSQPFSLELPFTSVTVQLL